MSKSILTIVFITCLTVCAYAGDTPISTTTAQDQIKSMEGRIGLNTVELTIGQRLKRIEQRLDKIEERLDKIENENIKPERRKRTVTKEMREAREERRRQSIEKRERQEELERKHNHHEGRGYKTNIEIREEIIRRNKQIKTARQQRHRAARAREAISRNKARARNRGR